MFEFSLFGLQCRLQLLRLSQYRRELPSHIKSSVYNRAVFDLIVTVIVIEKVIEFESWLHFDHI